MRHLTTVLAVGLILGTPAFAADDDWKTRLQEDVVKVEDGKFVYDDLSICAIKAPAPTGRGGTRPAMPSQQGSSGKFQVKSYAEAPSRGVISRDNFVAMITYLETVAQLSLAEAAGNVKPSEALNTFNCDPIEAPIGTVDLTMSTTMTAEGIQVEFTTGDGGSSRATHRWADLYGK